MVQMPDTKVQKKSTLKLADS